MNQRRDAPSAADTVGPESRQTKAERQVGPEAVQSEAPGVPRGSAPGIPKSRLLPTDVSRALAAGVGGAKNSGRGDTHWPEFHAEVTELEGNVPSWGAQRRWAVAGATEQGSGSPDSLMSQLSLSGTQSSRQPRPRPPAPSRGETASLRSAL